jgi:hypothetical protein
VGAGAGIGHGSGTALISGTTPPSCRVPTSPARVVSVGQRTSEWEPA